MGAQYLPARLGLFRDDGGRDLSSDASANGGGRAETMSVVLIQQVGGGISMEGGLMIEVKR